MAVTLFMDEATYAPFGDLGGVRCHLRVWAGDPTYTAVVANFDPGPGDVDTETMMASLIDMLAMTLDSQIRVYELVDDEYEWSLYELARRDDGSLGWSPLDVDDLAADLGITAADITGED